MQFIKSLVVLASASSLAVAQRPSNTSVCDYYTTALLKQNTPANQYMLLQLLVNTAVIGNYTMPNVGVKVPGILAPGTMNGEAVMLAPYFSGALQSTNRNGKAVSVNFLDGGAAAPLMANKLPTTGSNQYTLMTHLYQYFGYLLGCSGYGMMGFPAYQGSGSQASVHRFMDLDANQVGYFIEQVGLSAQSFGVSMADVTGVGKNLSSIFDVKCAPAMPVVPSQGPMLQSICQAPSCPSAPMSNCSAYPAVAMPKNTTGGATAAMNGTGAAGSSNSSSSGSGSSGSGSSGSGSSGSGASGSASSGPASTASASGSRSTSGATANAAGFGAAFLGAAAFAFAL